MQYLRITRWMSSALLSCCLATAAAQTASISGHVTRADTNEPIANALVSLNNGFLEADAQGYYVFDNLPAGNYTLAVHAAPGLASQRYANHDYDSTMITVPSDAVALNDAQQLQIDFQIHRGASISGLLTSALTGTGVKQNVTVQRVNADTSLGGKLTSLGVGSYSIGGLAPGSFYVSFEEGDFYAPLYYQQAPNQALAQVVTVSLGQQLTGIDAQFTPTRTIEGTVSNAASGLPAPNVPVHAGYFTSGFPSFYGELNAARTDATGHYLLQGLPGNSSVYVWAGDEGIYFCQFYQASPGCAFFGPPASPDVVVGASEHRTGVDFQMQSGAFASGRVFDPDTNFTTSLIAVELISVNGGPATYAFPAADGKYQTTAVPVGDYYLELPSPPPNGVPIIYPDCSGCQLTPVLALHLTAAQEYADLDFAVPHLDLIFRGSFD